MTRNSFASSGVSPTSSERQFHMTENFQIQPATSCATTQTRLQQQRRRLPIRDNATFVSTALAPNGCLAAATPSEVRLYDVERQDRAKDIKPFASFHVKLMPKSESIRAVAISNDLLAVVTHFRLIVYEYRETGDIENNPLEDVRIDRQATWTPRSVAILQVSSTDTHRSAAAWIAVGGEGVNGVKLYQYSQQSSWNIPHDCRLNLKCPGNTGLVHAVGFSTFLHNNCFVIFAVTSENRVVCWEVRTCEIGSPTAVSRSDYDANATQNPSPHRGEITAVSVFESPSGTPYIFVATNQKHGSQLARSFIAPLGKPVSQWRSLPDKVAGRQLLSAAATSNGRFLILVEKGCMKILTLRAAFEGGLTCLEHSVEDSSSLGDTAKDICAISLSVKEISGCIEVTGVDGRGHLVSARVSVPGMLATAPLPLTRRPQREPTELPSHTIVRELCGKEVSHTTRVDSTVSEWERVSEEIQVMLGS